jgi:hypothetical protein
MSAKYLIVSGRIDLINKVISKIDFPQIIVTVDIDQDVYNDRFQWLKLINGDYDNFDWSTIPPADSELLNKMGECERFFLKMSERNFSSFSYQFRKELYVKHLRFWNAKLNSNINFAIFENIPHEGFDFVIYSLCKLKGIKTLMFYTLPVRPNKSVLMHAFTDLFNPGIEIGQTYNRLLTHYSNNDNEILQIILPEYLNNYLKEQEENAEEIISFTRAEKSVFIDRFNKFNIHKKINSALKYIVRLDFNNFFKAFIVNNYRDPFFEKDIIVEKFYNKHVVEPDFTKKFIYFPLHFQPEGSTSPIGGNYVDQALVCEMLSWVAGSSILIYVKEHPRSSKVDYIRNIAFYKRLLACKNVKFLDRNFNSYNLIDRSIAVATVTGSAGWESFLRKKIVFMFGSRFYETAPGVFKISKIQDLENAFKIVLNNENIITRDKVLFFLKALESHVFEGFIPECDSPIATVSRGQSDEKIAQLILDFVQNLN